MANAPTRPELACEIVPEGIIAARRQSNSALLAGAAFVAFGNNAPVGSFAPYLDRDAPRVGLPGVQTGDPTERDAVVQAVRRAMESVGGRSGVLTLIVPDTAVRILLMDFDSLPHKAAEAVPLLRFRLKKLVPFDADTASISYQTTASATGVRVLVAAMARPILDEYEAVVREAGFEPGIVLPSALACLGMVADDAPALLVHANTQSVTTTIVRGADVLLHRTQELPWRPEQLAQTMNPAATETTPIPVDESVPLETMPASAPSEFLEPAATTSDEMPVLSDAAELPPLESAPEVATLASDAVAATPTSFLPGTIQSELQHALAVAAAFYEDSVGPAPVPVLAAGAIEARLWQTLAGEENVTLRDLVASNDLGTALDSGLSRAQLGAVCGALRG